MVKRVFISLLLKLTENTVIPEKVKKKQMMP